MSMALFQILLPSAQVKVLDSHGHGHGHHICFSNNENSEKTDFSPYTQCPTQKLPKPLESILFCSFLFRRRVTSSDQRVTRPGKTTSLCTSTPGPIALHCTSTALLHVYGPIARLRPYCTSTALLHVYGPIARLRPYCTDVHVLSDDAQLPDAPHRAATNTFASSHGPTETEIQALWPFYVFYA
jgi:hypothetical protein